jgi:hypothetical protein
MQTGEIALQPIQDEELKQTQLTTMKRRATGLLVLAFVVYVVARVMETRWPGFGYLRATAEAAMIGDHPQPQRPDREEPGELRPEQLPLPRHHPHPPALCRGGTEGGGVARPPRAR